MSDAPRQLLATTGYIREEMSKIESLDVPDDIMYICYKYWQHLVEIPIEPHSNRESLHNLEGNGPKCLLVDDTDHYWSPFDEEFAKDEEDWIIFQLKSDDNILHKYYWLKQIKIKNADYEQCTGGVKEMRIEVSKDTKEWFICNPNPICVEKNSEYQTFDINIRFMKNIKYYKIVFMTNHFGLSAVENRSPCKFVVNRLHLYGVW